MSRANGALRFVSLPAFIFTWRAQFQSDFSCFWRVKVEEICLKFLNVLVRNFTFFY